jgi:hypothetical protein
MPPPVRSPGRTSLLYPEGLTPSRLTEGPDGLYGTTNSGGGPGLGGTVFKITFSGGGTPIPPPAPPPTASALDSLTAFDPNTQTLRRIIPLFGVPGGIPWDMTSYQALAGAQPSVTGFVADGLTPLVLRVHASAPDAKGLSRKQTNQGVSLRGWIS